MSQEHVTLKNIEDSHLTNFPDATAMERTTTIIQDQLMVRINGTLPDISTLGTEEKSERAAEVKKQQDTNPNTSCSLFAKIETGQKMFHLLVDIGQGVVKSIERDLGFRSSSSSSSTSFIPDALLITHSHDDHVRLGIEESDDRVEVRPEHADHDTATMRMSNTPNSQKQRW